MANGNWKDTVKALAQDLTSIEVNTVIADGMTGSKMPIYPAALKDIAEKFASYLCATAHLNLDHYFDKAAAAIAREDKGDPPNPNDKWWPDFVENGKRTAKLASDWKTFRVLLWAAIDVLEGPKKPADPDLRLKPEDMPILSRIRRHCGELAVLTRRFDNLEVKKLLERPHDDFYNGFDEIKPKIPVIAAVDLTRIRKIWELGTNQIALQSVVQMDGDIVFRAARTLDLSDRAALVEAHRRATDLGVAHWRTMFGLLTDMVSGAIKALFTGR